MLKTTSNGTFIIQILDQQYDSWQGILTMIENNEKKSFRSTLELIRLIDNALLSGKAKMKKVKRKSREQDTLLAANPALAP